MRPNSAACLMRALLQALTFVVAYATIRPGGA